MVCSMPGFSILYYLLSLPKLMSTASVMPSNHLILCHPLLPPSIFCSIRVLSSESIPHIRWPKCWSFSFSVSPSSEYSGLISFRIDWFDLLAVQGTLKSLFQHHSSKASVLQCSAFFMVQHSHPYMTTEKPIALTIQTFVGKVMSLWVVFDKALVVREPSLGEEMCLCTVCENGYPMVQALVPACFYSVNIKNPSVPTSRAGQPLLSGSCWGFGKDGIVPFHVVHT